VLEKAGEGRLNAADERGESVGCAKEELGGGSRPLRCSSKYPMARERKKGGCARGTEEGEKIKGLGEKKNRWTPNQPSRIVPEVNITQCSKRGVPGQTGKEEKGG